MPAQTTPITERQRALITRAQRDTGGLIEPLLDLKGGAKLKMIAALVQRGLIEQHNGQWHITRAARAIATGEAQPEDVLPPTVATPVATPPLIDDPGRERAVAAETSRQQQAPHTPKRRRDNSKQALVIALLQRPEGASIDEICAATGWQPHTVRGAIAGTLKKKLGLAIVAEKIEGPDGTPGVGQRRYRIAAEAHA
jgi:DNA-binding MarR family transcriptional regulator